MTALHGLSVQFLSNLWSVQIFQMNFYDRSPYSLYNFRGTCDRSVHIFKGIEWLVQLKGYYYWESYDRSVQIFKGIRWSVQLKCYYCWESCDRSVQIFKGIRQLVQLKGYYCSNSSKVAIDWSTFSNELCDWST